MFLWGHRNFWLAVQRLRHAVLTRRRAAEESGGSHVVIRR